MSTQPHDLAPAARNTKRYLSADDAALAALIARVQARDAAALAELYEQTVGRIYALAHCIVRNRADAEDVVCDVYERAWLTASRYEPERGDVFAWLTAICRNRAIDELRQRHARGRRGAAHGRTKGDGDTAAVTLDSHLFEPGSAIVRAVAELSPERREVLALAFCRGLSHREIADELALPLGTVKSHLRRAIFDLRATLGAPGLGEP